MKRICILNCYEVSKKCSGTGCINAFNNKTGSFDKYAFEDAEIVSFLQCGGCSENAVKDVIDKAEQIKQQGVEAVHLSTCIRSKCQWYNDFIDVLSKEFEVADYTHGRKK